MCISVSVDIYICVHCQYTLQDTLRRRVFTYQSDDGLSQRDAKAALSADRPRDGPRWHEEGANFPRIPSVYSRIDGKTTFFIFAFFCSHEKETLLRMRDKEKFID